MVEGMAGRYGFRLHRQGKHLVFRDARGQQVVVARSPSDQRALQNIEAQFRRAAARGLTS